MIICHRFKILFPKGLELHFITFLLQECWSKILMTGCPSGVNHTHGLSYILAGIQLIQIVCTSYTTQNRNINLRSKPPIRCILQHTWVEIAL